MDASLQQPYYSPWHNAKVTFYVPGNRGRFRAVVMPDVDEPFVPVSPESLGAPRRTKSWSKLGNTLRGLRDSWKMIRS